jgi:hypothetical protein
MTLRIRGSVPQTPVTEVFLNESDISVSLNAALAGSSNVWNILSICKDTMQISLASNVHPALGFALNESGQVDFSCIPNESLQYQQCERSE